MTSFELLIGTIKLRPYVFIFLFFYLLAAIYLLGVRRTLLFTAICWLTAFISEYSSTRNGFPYGLYHYIETTRDRELWISNVPFMDSLSYTFLQFSALSMTLYGFFGLKNGQLQLAKPWKPHWLIAAVSAFMVMCLDVIIDPVANQGEKWFLGKIYFYPTGGSHFGVPLTNYAGWFLVGFVSILTYLKVEALLPLRQPTKRNYPLLFGDLWGVLLYLGVALFNLGVTLYIGDFRLFVASSLTLLIACRVVGLLRQRLQRQPIA